MIRLIDFVKTDYARKYVFTDIIIFISFCVILNCYIKYWNKFNLVNNLSNNFILKNFWIKPELIFCMKCRSNRNNTGSWDSQFKNLLVIILSRSSECWLAAKFLRRSPRTTVIRCHWRTEMWGRLDFHSRRLEGGCIDKQWAVGMHMHMRVKILKIQKYGHKLGRRTSLVF